MNMFINPRSRNTPQIRSEVETMGFALSLQCLQTACRYGHDLPVLLSAQRCEVGRVFIRHNHDMPTIVREQIQHSVAMLPPPYHKILLVFLFPGDPAEETTFLPLLMLEGLDVRRAPG